MQDRQDKLRLRATTYIRNDYMLSARKKKNLSQRKLSELSGVGQQCISNLERLKYPVNYPLEKIAKISIVLEIPPEQIMPEVMAGWSGQTKFSVTKKVQINRLLEYKEYQEKHYLLPSPVEIIENKDKMAKINLLLDTLSYREREIIKLRYGLEDGYAYTLEEVGRIFKVTRARVRAVEARAIRKLENRASNPRIMKNINTSSLDYIE